jgi:hypothetical protein
MRAGELQEQPANGRLSPLVTLPMAEGVLQRLANTADEFVGCPVDSSLTGFCLRHDLQ